MFLARGAVAVAGKMTVADGNGTITAPRETTEHPNAAVGATTVDPNAAVGATTEDLNETVVPTTVDPNVAVEGTTEDLNETVDRTIEDPVEVMMTAIDLVHTTADNNGTTDEQTVATSAGRKESDPDTHTTNLLGTSEHRGNLNEAMIEWMWSSERRISLPQRSRSP